MIISLYATGQKFKQANIAGKQVNSVARLSIAVLQLPLVDLFAATALRTYHFGECEMAFLFATASTTSSATSSMHGPVAVS